MAKRLHHKTADFRGIIGSREGYSELCYFYYPYNRAKKPILELNWLSVTCQKCREAKQQGVPDHMGLKIVK